MLENRKKVIYTGLAILVSMTSNICTFPIYETEANSPSEKFKIQLNGEENTQIQKIVVEKINANNYLKTASGEVKVVSEDDDNVYYVYNSTLIKAQTIENGSGQQEVIVQTTELNNVEESQIEKEYENIQPTSEMVIGVDKEDNIAPVIQLKKNKVTLTTNETFNPMSYVKEATDNVDVNVEVYYSGDVNTDVPGSYEVIYTATDLSGNVTEEVLGVDVVQGINYGSIAKAAKAQIGRGQDCTMLVTNSLKAVGINFHGSPYEYTSLGEFTKNPVPGDICIYEGHVALYIGNGRAIHGGFNGTTVESSVGCSNAFIGYIHVRDTKK